MTPPQRERIPAPALATGSLRTRLRQIHERLRQVVPVVERISCVLYDEHEGTLKTFIDSTLSGELLTSYERKLVDCPSLERLARSGELRIVEDIPQAPPGSSRHALWLAKNGYRSSMTVPLYGDDSFLGFVFFDSRSPAAFSPAYQRDTLFHANLVNLLVWSELSAIRLIAASALVARDFVHLRDFETGAHLERMALYARLIAGGVAGKHGLSDEFIEQVYLFAPLHDIGKIGIPDRVLLKPGRLEGDELMLMKTHAERGCELVDRIIDGFALSQLPDTSIMRNIVACHHEMLDGSGYPDGLAGAALPLEARIVTVADIFDALTNTRPYKDAWSFDAAFAELRRMVAAGKLDPDCVAALEARRDEVEAVHQRYQDAAPIGEG